MSDYDKKVEEYKEYIDNHIKNVQKSFERYGKELASRLSIDYDRLAYMIQEHDKSKYSEEEFEGYRCHFYPTDEELADIEMNGFRKTKYDNAWLHHLRNNAHHPEFWIYADDDGNPKCHPMDTIYVAEMLLDWAAMSITKNDNVYEYWHKNAYSKPLHYDTIVVVDNCIDIFK